MYVIFPAQDVVDLYWSSSSSPPSTSPIGSQSVPSPPVPRPKMSSECSLRDLTHPGLSEDLKAQNALTFKLVKTVSDFTQQLATLHEQHAEELQLLVENFRKKNAELRRERPLYHSTLFNVWETFLQEVEVDSQVHSDVASIMGRHVSIPLLERTFYRKVQSRKIFTHRESYETILSKTEELLYKCHKEYTDAYEKMLKDRRIATIEACTDAHNVYVQQLHAANAMIEEYYKEALPQLLDELEEVYLDLTDTVSRSILEGAEIISCKAHEQNNRYESMCTSCKAVNGKVDLANYVKTLSIDKAPADSLKHEFIPPHIDMEGVETPLELSPPLLLKNEVIIDKSLVLPMRNKYDSLRKEAVELEAKIKGLQESMESLIRLQQRSVENSLFNKANEIQEDISLKRFDLRTAQIHVGAVRAQLDLLGSALEDKQENIRDRKMSGSSTGSMKSKWLKAFKSLKTGASSSSSGSAEKKVDKKDSTKENRNGDTGLGILENAHIFQEYTYKKITPCDVCHEILRGHTRQGIRCKMCKMNVHPDCQDKLGKCQTKPRLLRRQKSTSEIETRIMEKEEERNHGDQFLFKFQRQGTLVDGRAHHSSFISRESFFGHRSFSKSTSVESAKSSEPSSPGVGNKNTCRS